MPNLIIFSPTHPRTSDLNLGTSSLNAGRNQLAHHSMFNMKESKWNSLISLWLGSFNQIKGPTISKIKDANSSLG